MLGLSRLCLEMVSRCPACNAPACHDACSKYTCDIKYRFSSREKEIITRIMHIYRPIEISFLKIVPRESEIRSYNAFARSIAA